MAVSFVGVVRRTTITQWNLAEVYDYSLSAWVPLPVDDLLVIIGTRAGNVSVVSVPGWNVLFGGRITRTHSSRNVGVGLWWKFRTSDDATLTLPDMNALSPTGNYTIYAFRGVDKANPFDLTPDAVAHVISGAAVPNPPAVTPVTVGAMVAYWGCNWTNGGTRDLLWNSPIVQAPFRAPGTSDKYSSFPQLPHRFGYFANWSSGAVDGAMSSVYSDASIVPALVFRPAGTGGNAKVWNGSAWVTKPVKYWNGSAWVTKPVKHWNGSAWVTTPY